MEKLKLFIKANRHNRMMKNYRSQPYFRDQATWHRCEARVCILRATGAIPCA